MESRGPIDETPGRTYASSSDPYKMWRVIVMYEADSGAYFMPLTYPGETVEDAIDRALEYFDVRYLAQSPSMRLHSVEAAPDDEFVRYELTPRPTPGYERARKHERIGV